LIFYSCGGCDDHAARDSLRNGLLFLEVCRSSTSTIVLLWMQLSTLPSYSRLVDSQQQYKCDENDDVPSGFEPGSSECRSSKNHFTEGFVAWPVACFCEHEICELQFRNLKIQTISKQYTSGF
jgi:hypothetical protein